MASRMASSRPGSTILISRLAAAGSAAGAGCATAMIRLPRVARAMARPVALRGRQHAVSSQPTCRPASIFVKQAKLSANRPSSKLRTPSTRRGTTEMNETAPGEVAAGQIAPGEVAAGQMAPGQMVPGEVAPGQTAPGETTSGQAAPG